MAGRSNPRHARRRRQGGPSAATVIGLLVCVVCFSAAFFLWKAALFGSGRNESGEEPFRPVVGDPPYRVCIDAGHGGSDPGARGVVEEKEMTAQTSEALLALLEADPNYIPLRSRESYDVTAKPSERAEAINAQSPQLLLSIHGNSAPEGSAAAGFECYPSVPGRTWHQESYYFAQQLAQGMQAAGAKLRGHGGIRYIYYQGEVKQLVESTHTEVRDERSFTLLEDVNCPAVLAEQWNTAAGYTAVKSDAMDARMKAVLSSCILRCLLGRRSTRPKRNDIKEQQRLPKPAPMTERRRRGPLFLIFIIFRIMQVIRNIGERKSPLFRISGLSGGS